jgi:RHS repeat-associated protein
MTLAASTNSVGRTPGSYSVDPYGAFNYSIPIPVAPGPKGVAPHIALTYNSRSGNGTLGVGWSLGGLSSIVRCNATVAQDGVAAAVALTYSDRFCMGGKRLRLTNDTHGGENLADYGMPGTAYQTEVADFSLVTANGTAGNGPASFTVQGKDGYTYLYGVSNSAGGTNSQVLASGSTTASSWMLSQIEDRLGNTLVAINYSPEQGTAVPSSISWSPTSAGATTFNYVMNFTYGTNSPLTSVYLYEAATPVALTDILQAITLSYNGTEYLNYVLTYQTSPTTGRNLLTQVQECAGSTQTNCLAPTTMTYQAGAAGVAAPATSTGASSSVGTVMTADINGDGQEDIIYSTGSGSTVSWWVQFATSSGFTAPVSTGATTNSGTWIWPLIDDFLGTGAKEIMAPNNGTWYVYTWNGTNFTGTSTGIAVDSAATTFAVADINGDGKADLAALDLISGTYYIVTRLNTSTGSTVSFSSTTTSTQTNVTNSSTEFIQGKGLYGDNDITNTPVRHFDWNGNKLHGFMLTYVMDINEGRRGEVAFNYMEAWAPNGTGGFSSVDQWISQKQAYSIPTPVNWNDDACTDLYFEGLILLSGCNGGTQGQVSIYSSATGMESVVALDWSGHKRSDILANFGGGSTLTEYTSTGTGVSAGVATSLSAGNYAVFNPTGDGFDDLVTIGSSSLLYGLHNGAGQPADLVGSITDGYGVNVSPSYVSIAQSHYTEKFDGSLPDAPFIGAFYVVGQLSATSPASAGGSYVKTYNYTGAHLNTQGRGFDGFESIQINDSRPGSLVEVDKYYEVSAFPLFPFAGAQIELDLYQNNGTTPVSTTVNTPDSPVDTLDPTAGNQRYFPYFTSSTTSTYEVGGTENGTLITGVNTSYAFDNYGNTTSITKVVTDDDPNSPYVGKTWKTTTTSNFDVDGSDSTADLAAWCLTMPQPASQGNGTTVATLSTLSGSTATSVIRTYLLDTPAKCRTTSEVTAPGTSYQVTEAYSYDAFGNLSADTVTGTGMTARETQIGWGTTGQFPQTITNALTQATTLNYNFNFGEPSSITDPNGIPTAWTYDSFGRLSNETRPDGTQTAWGWNWCTSNCSWENSEYYVTRQLLQTNGTTVIRTDTTTYDPFDNVTEISGPTLTGATSIVQKVYDRYGNVAQQSFPYLSGASSYWQTITYDPLTRITAAQRPISSTNSTLQGTTYQYAGRTITATDANNNTKSLIIDVNGWQRQTTDAVGYSVITGYDAAGNKNLVKDSVGHTLSSYTYYYGIGAFPNTSYDADLGNWTYTPDALGEMTNWIDAKGQHFSVAYDQLGRPTSRTEPDLVTVWLWGTSAGSHNIGKLAGTCTGSGCTPTPSYCATASGYCETESYDSDGRQTQRIITLPGSGQYPYTQSYSSTTGLPQSLTYPTTTSSYALEIQYNYTNAMLASITNLSDSPNWTIWQANQTDAVGHILSETAAPTSNGAPNNIGLGTTRTVDAVTGWLSSVTAGTGGTSTLENQSYLFDHVGNLTQRQNNNLSLTENFYYDKDYRLYYSQLNGSTNLQMCYDNTGGACTENVAGMGNITSRSDVASGTAWTYDLSRYHAVTQAGTGTGAYTYGSYDANGNPGTRNGSTISWSSYNFPTSITAIDSSGTETVQFSYGPDRKRWNQNLNSGAETTYYVGGLLEEVETSYTDWRHYVYAGSQPIAVYSRKSTGGNNWSYILKDSLGSVATLVGPTGSVEVSESFTPFGARRNSATWAGAPSSGDLTFSSYTRQGFTWQTALGQTMNLNHMNGRVEDAVTGRFLSPDPTMPDPTNSQSYNRFSYVLNRPLTLQDPTGFSQVCVPSYGYINGGDDDDDDDDDDDSGIDTVVVSAQRVITGFDCSPLPVTFTDSGNNKQPCGAIANIVGTAQNVAHVVTQWLYSHVGSISAGTEVVDGTSGNGSPGSNIGFQYNAGSWSINSLGQVAYTSTTGQLSGVGTAAIVGIGGNFGSQNGPTPSGGPVTTTSTLATGGVAIGEWGANVTISGDPNSAGVSTPPPLAIGGGLALYGAGGQVTNTTNSTGPAVPLVPQSQCGIGGSGQ